MVQGGEEPPQLIGRVDVKLFLLLANTWPSLPDGHSATTKDPTGWWISEKLDGVRALWDGRCLWSRRGKPWSAPTWFTEQLPADMPLDGELWIGRGLFEHTSSVCRSTTSDEWHHIKYMIFDTPGWQTERVEERWARLERVFPVAESDQWRSLKAGPYLVKHTRCTCVNHLNDLLDHVLSLGGEGVMLRRPESL
ncbi:dna ligase [Malassezia pachydermatis]|uniref:Dna ligase n=1 Tax=Malassezia pachydermatis TaxID=77020 RepID=A0A0M9VN21_9BASI|nr:dna ligase [Malassezia pachydermatis]KOS12883.1 dna ligase [Malassezia pachydermatis]